MFDGNIYHIFIGIFVFRSLNAQTCDNGWFGSRCQFQCRCQTGYCKNDGSCNNNYRCANGWFGYKCQYQDIVYSATLQGRPNYDVSSWKDRYNRNCNGNSYLQSVEIKLNQQSPFSWMRIVAKDTSSLTKVLLSFKQGSNVLQCDNQRMHLVDNMTVDIRCEIYSAIQSVIIEGEIVKSICSVYINGGRNVALKGETNSSSSISKDDHKLAVDGKTDGQFIRGGSCTHSEDEDKTPSWTLTLKEDYLVDRIDLYNRGDCCVNRLRNFSLTATDNTGSHSFTYIEPDSVQSKYSVLPMKYLEISFLKIQATYIENKLSILTLCEVEVYGDCLPTKWGLDCVNDCDSKCPKACHIEDGTCDTSCVGYFDPPSCAKKCTPGNWGINCSNDCGNKCYGTCNVFSGYCDEGCLGFQNPPLCTEACAVGSYGRNCTSKCSANCKQSKCQPETGECIKCKDGYTGKFCDEACTTGRWGEKCSKDCNVKCYDTCHHEKGVCHLGCQGYSDPPWCLMACLSGLYGKNCTSVCSANCVDSKCNSTTGECFSCVSGHFGIMCEFDQSSSENDKQNSTLIYVTVAAIFTVILIIIVVIILIRRRFQVTNHSKSEDLQRMSILKNRDFESDNKLNSDLEATYQNTSGHSQEDTSVPIQDLFTYITSHNSDFYKSQFQSVPLAKGVSTNVAQSEENRSKNRYKNICPYDHNRVHLDKNSTKSHSDYINASHINGYNNVESFIASQGPHKAILNDFIRMLWEQCIERIAMLTSLAEDGKMKCEQYWPDEGKIQFGDIKVKLLSTENFADYSVRILELSEKGGKRHTVTQFHYLAWPDKGVPSNPWSFAEFQHRVSSEPTPKALLVHCSAGAGRTGSYIALHHILRQAEMTGKVNFYQTLVKLRQDRMCMIQTAAQYEFVHIAALVSMTCSGSFRKPAEFNDMFKLMMANTGLSNEYTKLCKICKYLHGLETSSQPVQDAEVYQNMEKSSGDSKNRFSSILPKDAHRPLLTKESNEMGDYVNAIFISGLKRKSQFILTQLPMPTTVVDFWRLVTQYNVCLIVAFEMDEKETDSSYGQYLPTDHQMKLSMLEIETTDLNRSSLWEEQKLLISMKKSLFVPQTQNVIHLKCLFTDLNDCSKLLSISKKIRSYGMSEERVIFMCRNGASYSGLACVLTLLLDSIEHSGWFSVPVVVGSVKSVRPEVISTLDQYLHVYKVLQRHIELSSQYNNVSEDFVKTDNSIQELQNHAEDNNDEVYANV